MDHQTERLLLVLQTVKPSTPPPLNELRHLFEKVFYHPVPSFKGKVEEDSVEGPYGSIPVRIYRPAKGKGPLPVLVLFHGGGWATGNLQTHDPFCRYLCQQTGFCVVAVDYRLAPEHPFPIPVEECYEATRWVAKYAEGMKFRKDRIVVCGESAGGNLAAAVALMAKDRGGPKLAAQILIFPALAPEFDTPSYHWYKEGFLLTREEMIKFWGFYLGKDKKNKKNPYAAPLLAKKLSSLPPALILLAENDVLHDDGFMYAHRLESEGVKVVTHSYDTIHGFILFPHQLDIAKQALEDIDVFLKGIVF